MGDNLRYLLLSTESRIAFCDPASFPGSRAILLDTDTIETFTLESFKELMVSHFRGGLDFVVAQLTTEDCTGENTFHSFYSASEINRVLFCVGDDNKLLYRVKMRNPINNLDVVGEVKYYRVTQELVLGEIERRRGTSRDTLCSAAGEEMHMGEHMASAIQKHSGTADALRRIFGSLVLRSEFFATDEDVLFRPGIREYIEGNSLYGTISYINFYSKQTGAIVLYDDTLEAEPDEKLSLKLILYANIGTVLTMLGMCLFLGHSENFIAAIVPLTLTLLFSVFFLLLYVIIFETPESILRMLCFDKDN
jgi:hypothetical protein